MVDSLQRTYHYPYVHIIKDKMFLHLSFKILEGRSTSIECAAPVSKATLSEKKKTQKQWTFQQVLKKNNESTRGKKRKKDHRLGKQRKHKMSGKKEKERKLPMTLTQVSCTMSYIPCWPTSTYIKTTIKQQPTVSQREQWAPFSHSIFYMKFVAPHLPEEYLSDDCGRFSLKSSSCRYTESFRFSVAERWAYWDALSSLVLFPPHTSIFYIYPWLRDFIFQLRVNLVTFSLPVDSKVYNISKTEDAREGNGECAWLRREWSGQSSFPSYKLSRPSVHTPSPSFLLKTFLCAPAMTGGPDFHLENLATLCLQHLPA